MKKITLNVLGLVLISSILLNAYFLFKKDKVSDIKIIKTERIDTITDTIPKLITKKYVKTITDTFSSKEFIHDTLTNTVEVKIPITQKEYSDDSTYTAWISGYKPELDSISVYHKTITIEKTITKKDNKRFGIGPSITYGYDIPNKKFGLTIGVSAHYDLIKW